MPAGAKVSVKMDHLKLKMLSDAQILAMLQTQEQMLHEIVTDQVIPFDTGNLQNVQTYPDTKAARKGKVAIVHETPYARRLYYHPEYNFQTTFNPNAKGLWWDDWINGPKKNRPKELFKKFYKRLGGV
jgi:hypothetical protein